MKQRCVFLLASLCKASIASIKSMNPTEAEDSSRIPLLERCIAGTIACRPRLLYARSRIIAEIYILRKSAETQRLCMFEFR